MAKVHIFQRNLPPGEIGPLRTLIIAAGCERDEVDTVKEISQATDGCADEIFIVPFSPQNLADPELSGTLLKCIDGGRRVIGVWPQGATTAEVPTTVTNLCFSVVRWDEKRLALALKDDDFVCFEAPTGEPLPLPSPERRECPEK